MTPIRRSLTPALLLGMALLWGCSTGGQNLKPASSAKAVAGQPAAAQATDQQTQIVVEAETWPGDAAITRKLTPLKVTIRNNGERPLRMTYDSFVLEGSAENYPVIPPFEVDGTVASEDVLTTTYWTYDRFAAAPYYGAYYPGAPLYATDLGIGPYYYDYYGRWAAMEELPTPEMLAWALPEGVIDPGGQVSGYLYFERVDDDEQVTFQARLQSTEQGGEAVNVSIPFTVVED